MSNKKQSKATIMFNETNRYFDRFKNDTTRKAYVANFRAFLRYCSREKKCAKLDECRKYIQTYADFLTAQGKTTVTVKTVDGSFTSTCEVTVVNPVRGITISDNSFSLYTGSTRQLSKNIAPSNADNTNVVWVSSNDSVASVDSNGLVTAAAPGTVTITVRSVDGGYSANCTVTVGKHVSSVYLSDEELSLAPGMTSQITATVMPLKALNKNVTWLSMNEKVATVDSQGNVNALKTGKAVIYVETEDGECSATCTVNVTNSALGYTLNSKSEYIGVNGTVQLSGVFNPTTAANQNVSWTTSDNSVATVSNTGLVTGLTSGSAVITATTQDGGYKDYCLVKVVGLTPIVNSGAVVDTKNGYIYGLNAGTKSLDSYVTLTDSSCTLEYKKSSAGFGTGTVVNILKDKTVLSSYTVIIFGDVNGDGWYDGQDNVTVNCIANGMLTSAQVGKAVYLAADCNHDGTVDAKDVSLLEQAGALSATINQSATSEELQTGSVYQQYIELIDQSVDSETPAEVDHSEQSAKGIKNLFETIKQAVIKILLYIKMALSILK